MSSEYIYEFEAHRAPWIVAEEFQEEIAKIGGSIFTTRVIAWEKSGVTVAFSDRYALAEYIRCFYSDGGMDDGGIEAEVASIREI